MKVKLIVNGHEIYLLTPNTKVIIPVQQNNPKIVVTDGYHISKPLELVYHHIHTYYLKVECAISDFQLGAGLMLMAVCGAVGLGTGFLFLKLLSFFPVVYFLFLYYINKNDFIQIRPT